MKNGIHPQPLFHFSKQKKIVAKLDELSVNIKGNQEQIRDQIAKLDELWQSKLSQIFGNSWTLKNLPPNRQLKNLWDICKFQNGFAFQSQNFRDKWEPILRISNIQNDWFSDERLVFFNLSDYDKNLDDFIVYPWDLVIAMSWATTGKLAVNNTKTKYYLNQRVWKFIFDNEITKKYCHLFLSTKITENLQKSVWSAIPNLSTEQIKSIQIPLPSLEIQKAIVAELDELQKTITELKSHYTMQLQHYDDLRNSILDQAFKGELVK